MSPVEGQKRIFWIKLKSVESEIKVIADKVCKPAGTNHFYFFKDGNGDSVAEYHRDDVTGWRIKQITR